RKGDCGMDAPHTRIVTPSEPAGLFDRGGRLIDRGVRLLDRGVRLREQLQTATLVRLGEVTNRTLVLPLLVFSPTSRCNSRCVSCDWWKQSGADDLTLPEIARVADAVAGLGTRVVAFSGGEPLLRPEVFE